jgi:hypothetical protein
MKKFLLLFVLTAAIFACSDDDSEDTTFTYSSTTTDCGSHNGKPLHRGSEGGCYYYNSNGNKTYVDRSECKC